MNSITLEKIPAYVETYLSIRDRVQQNEINRAEALKQLTAARKDAGFDTDANDFLTASVEDLEALTADFSRPVVAEVLPFVGAYNADTGKWENSDANKHLDLSRVGVGAYDHKSGKWI